MRSNYYIKLMLVVLLLPLALVISACGTQEAEPTQSTESTDSTGLNVGDTAPDFSLPASDGSTVSLSDYADKPVLLYFHMAVG